MLNSCPRIVLSATRGGAGKTVLSLGLIAAWKDDGLKVAPFKKGPDFIDAGWLGFAAGRPCYNLDAFLMDPEGILASFRAHSLGADLAVVEGNRGLYDGLDVEGSCSTAELAKCIRAPVLLILDVTMATRTVAALVRGCQTFDPGLVLAGVILNRVAGPRQETLIRRAIETACGLPVLGAVPKTEGRHFPERHMGLVPHLERNQAEKAVAWARDLVVASTDRHRIYDLCLPRSGDLTDAGPPAREAHPCPTGEPLVPHSSFLVPNSSFLVPNSSFLVPNSSFLVPHSSFLVPPPHPCPTGEPLRIGVLRDEAFWFYYPENLEQIEREGARILGLSAIRDASLPPLDGLYIGGGFPETQAGRLADNRPFRESVRAWVERGLPVYAECGGLMYLGEGLEIGDATYPMVGAVPYAFRMDKRPQGHGYTLLHVEGENPFYPLGTCIRGHEFHYSRPIPRGEGRGRFAFRVLRGQGLVGGMDGFCTGNLLATYTHVHAGGDRGWGPRFLDAARAFREAGPCGQEIRACEKKMC